MAGTYPDRGLRSVTNTSSDDQQTERVGGKLPSDPVVNRSTVAKLGDSVPTVDAKPREGPHSKRVTDGLMSSFREGAGDGRAGVKVSKEGSGALGSAPNPAEGKEVGRI